MFLIRIVPFLLILVYLLTACQSPDNLPGTASQSNEVIINKSKFIAVEKYLEMHPEEKRISKEFYKIVQNPGQPMEPGVQVKPVTISFVYPGQQASDYWRRSVSSFVARMDELGIQFELKEFFSKGGRQDIRKQEQQLKEALEYDPDYLVFTFNVNRHQKLIESILAHGKPRLILQNITTPLNIWEDNQPFYVGFDHARGTRMLADYFLSKSSPDSRYGLLYYSKGYVSYMRGDTFVKYMRERNAPSLVGAYYTCGQRAKARERAGELLKMGELDFIYSCSTDVALSAADALQDSGLQGTMLNGWGGGSAELAAIKDGRLDVTVMRMNDDNGVAIAEAIHLALIGENASVPTIFSGDFALITSDTTSQEITHLKRRAFRYSGIPQ